MEEGEKQKKDVQVEEVDDGAVEVGRAKGWWEERREKRRAGEEGEEAEIELIMVSAESQQALWDVVYAKRVQGGLGVSLEVLCCSL